MIVLNCEQGSPEWLHARIGLPTASCFGKVLTPKARKAGGAGAVSYRAELVAEWLLGYPIDTASSGYMERGTDLEEEARAWYELQRDVEIERVGFILRDDGQVGGSPDGLVGEDGGVEIKCLSAAHHVAVLLGDVPDHTGQVQGLMYLTARAWWDLVFYSPVFPSLIVRTARDEDYIAALDTALDAFVANLNVAKEQLRAYKKESILAHHMVAAV